MDYIILGLLPVLSALIGWFTNFLAIRMIFRPRKAVSCMGIRVQGLLPRRQEEIALQVSETIEEEFFSSEDILKSLERIDLDKDIENFIDHIIDTDLPKILDGIPLLGSFISEGILSKVKILFKQEIEQYSLALGREIAEQAGNAVDVKEMVYEKISDYDIGRLEDIVKRIAGRELRHIEILGGVLGFVIGCIQVGIMYFTGLVSL
jgi:uncharacterized membrane protein YheB (UPF0754 family)